MMVVPGHLRSADRAARRHLQGDGLPSFPATTADMEVRKEIEMGGMTTYKIGEEAVCNFCGAVSTPDTPLHDYYTVVQEERRRTVSYTGSAHPHCVDRWNSA